MLLNGTERLSGLAVQLRYFSGLAHLSEYGRGAAGAILKFQRVRPAERGAFRPLASAEITPRFLDRTIRGLKRWGYEFISVGELAARLPHLAGRRGSHRRFVCLTFDTSTADFAKFAYPLLRHHAVPFAVYVPTGLVDGVALAWWLALEKVVAGNTRFSIPVSGKNLHFTATGAADKTALYRFLFGWLRDMPADVRHAEVTDLCRRFGADAAAITRSAAIRWEDLAAIASDPLASVGSATVEYHACHTGDRDKIMREMRMGRATLEAAVGRPCPHFAFPFGDRESFSTRDVMLAQEAGFQTAMTSYGRAVPGHMPVSALTLPRIAWDGRSNSLRGLRVAMSRPAKPEKVARIAPNEMSALGIGT